ncbi:hypothetical protein DER45DRAFT_580271 [Fusarium avenaceum]|nr:hypothetical protein DER45DRAFT_580271 [Fusarium avenaceum]
MDAVQLDTFIDQRRPVREIEGLADVDVSSPIPLVRRSDLMYDTLQRETITIAWRCAYWLAVLLNWDANEVYLIRAGRDALSLVEAKNLVLELAYSVAHRIQVLIRKLCHRAIKSINRLDESLDPVAICCALWMVFSATHKFEKRNFQAKSLKNLKHFLGNLRERSRAAFQSLDHYKRLIGASCCSRPRNNNSTFSKLIEDAKKPKAAITFACERFVSHPFLMKSRTSVFDTGLKPQSYSEILESKVLFQEDIALFMGQAASRNLAAPRPSDYARDQHYSHPAGYDMHLTIEPSPVSVTVMNSDQQAACGCTSVSAVHTPKSKYSSSSRLLYATSADSWKTDCLESRKRVPSDEGRSCSQEDIKRARKGRPSGDKFDVSV